MRKKYVVRLTTEERTTLQAMVSKGKVAAYRIKHASILLAADVEGPGWTDARIAEAFSCLPRKSQTMGASRARTKEKTNLRRNRIPVYTLTAGHQSPALRAAPR